MFSALRPSTDAIERFLRDSQELPLSYGPIGIVKEKSVVSQLDDEPLPWYALLTIGNAVDVEFTAVQCHARGRF